MSTFQIALIVIAAVALIGVVLYNAWQERRAARAVRATFGERDDALLRTTTPRAAPPDTVVARVEPTLGLDSLADVEPEFDFDDDLECIVTLSFDHAVDGERLVALTAPLQRTVGSKPVRCAATNVDSLRPQLPHAGAAYSGLHTAVLLANRAGPLNAVEFSEFVGAVRRIADEFDVPLDIPDMAETLERAKQLDARCAGVDGQIAVNIVSNGMPWSGSQIAQAAVEAGFAQRPEGRFAFLRRSGVELFTMDALDAQARPVPILVRASEVQSSTLTIVLDVPRAPEVEKPLSTLINVARALAARLGGSVVDDHRRPVTDQALTAIETQLKPMHDRLRAAGFEAGSPRALRLFN